MRFNFAFAWLPFFFFVNKNNKIRNWFYFCLQLRSVSSGNDKIIKDCYETLLLLALMFQRCVFR